MSLLNCFLKQAQLKIPEICFHKDTGLALPLVVRGVCGCCSASHKLLTWHLPLLAGLGEGSVCGQGAASRGDQGKANHREEKTRVPCLGQSGGSSLLLPNVTLSSLRVIFPFASNQITF